MNPAEIVKSVMSDEYIRDRFVSRDWSRYGVDPQSYEKDYKVMKRKDSVTVKIGGGYYRFSEEQKSEIVDCLKSKFSTNPNILDVAFMVSENYAGTKYDWLKIKVASDQIK